MDCGFGGLVDLFYLPRHANISRCHIIEDVFFLIDCDVDCDVSCDI